MIKIIADDKIPFLKGVLEPFADVRYLPGAKTGASDIKEADALITRTRTQCNKSNLADSKVKKIATATIGFDHIDTDFCKANNIDWSNAPGCNSGSVKQYLASVLALMVMQQNVRLSEKTIGIVGVGNVGKKVADLAGAIGMRVLLNDPPRAEKEGTEGFVELDEVIQHSDIITFHVPLQRTGKFATHHLANASMFSQCKKGVGIVNTCRGEVIDNKELLEAIQNGTVANAILDVWENEPDINLQLLDKCMVATPHIAGYSADGKANGTAASVQAISEYFNLPLKDWYPDDIPLPVRPEIHIDAQGLSVQDVWVKAVWHTYPILEDDERLRRSPDTFEVLRGSYPLRREFQAYHVQLSNGTEEMKEMLNKMGFCHVQLI